MSPASSPVNLKGTRLVRFLADLAVSDVAFSHDNFTDRLGRVINLQESLRLSAFHDQLSMTPYEPGSDSESGSGSGSCEGLTQDVLWARRALVQTVVASFAPQGGPARLQLPTLQADAPLDELVTFQPYHRFYIAHQREFESKIQSLQRRVRDQVCGLSRELAQLAALDATVWNILLTHTRSQFAVIPRLLGKRFDFLQHEYHSSQAQAQFEVQPEAQSESQSEAQPESEVESESESEVESEVESGAGSGTQVGDVQPQADRLETSTRSEAWQTRFLTETQGLLLAELELRLLPVLGLVEAVNEEVAGK